MCGAGSVYRAMIRPTTPDLPRTTTKRPEKKQGSAHSRAQVFFPPPLSVAAADMSERTLSLDHTEHWLAFVAAF